MKTAAGTRRPIYFRWWFWLGFLVLILGTFYLKSYFDWRGDYDLSHTDEYARGLAAQLLHYQSQQLDEQYKNDTYGGDTPEETLRLFVEAIEKKDFNLASKYFIPEDQKAALSKFEISREIDGTKGLVDAYKSGRVEGEELKATGNYQLRVYAKGDTIPFLFRLTKNTFTNKWKILEP